uniref:6-phosphofructokinase n=1 Tax=Megaselia scalaris TaxID=36166 RepID=T1GKC9_MEGSC
MQKSIHFVPRGKHKGKGLAVFTSGGDSQGMNATLRAVVRMGLFIGCKVFLIKEGYEGMVAGGDYIVEAHWKSVSNILGEGGTAIGSARCMEFHQREGRLQAAYNLIIKEINNIVVIGGDGSLTGANLFRVEWASLLNELLENRKIVEEQREKFAFLKIVGLVGSIDNDFCGTDMTIGTDTALFRIVEAIDAIVSTAHSHQRTFILEVMGRHCGSPPPSDWPDKLCNKLIQERNAGQRLNIIIVAEGSIDRDGSPISAEDVKKVVVDKLRQDTRITVLGHIQRGGRPSAFDRALGMRMGAEAVLTLLETPPDEEPQVIALRGNHLTRVPLMDCVVRTKAVSQAMANKNWDLAVRLRGKSFERNLESFRKLSRLNPKNSELSIGFENEYPKGGFRFGVMHIGNPACGMNTAVRSFVKNLSYYSNVSVFAIRNGIDGLCSKLIEPISYKDVNGWTRMGGSNIGARQTLPEGKFMRIAEILREFNIHGLVIIGGFNAFHSAGQIFEQREKFPEFCIPIIVIPATCSNNLPGTELTLGLRLSAVGTNFRTFVVETQGGNSGYLSTLAGVAGGADKIYIPEENFSVRDLLDDVHHIKAKMRDGVQRAMVVISEFANANYNSEFLNRLYDEEGKDVFSCRKSIIGFVQQGQTPSPFDRRLAIKMGQMTADWILNQAKIALQLTGKVRTKECDSAVLLGLLKRQYVYSPLKSLIPESNFEKRCVKNASRLWWIKLGLLNKIIARHSSINDEEGIFVSLKSESLQD